MSRQGHNIGKTKTQPETQVPSGTIYMKTAQHPCPDRDKISVNKQNSRKPMSRQGHNIGRTQNKMKPKSRQGRYIKSIRYLNFCSKSSLLA
jgi:hypothetical protein